jgi:hypothetical protein
MYEVVDTVTADADVENEPQAEDSVRRQRLMSVGHDPLRR